MLDRALALGGHLRTGLEDHGWLPDGGAAADSASQVAAWRDRAARAGRRALAPDAARHVLGLPPGPILRRPAA